jgi:4-amino-4-deoxy-L-arabinose transferase-like glycosyltransferase
MNLRARRLSLPLLLLLLLYWALALNQLTVLPRVYQDEPWQASTALKIAQEGIFGSDLFHGFARMEQHYYGYPPGYPLALALVFRTAGVGLFQSRWVGLACGILILALTFSLARRVWNDTRIAFLAGFLLLTVRWLAETKLHPTGILFFDATRLARYDVLVPVFGLASLHSFLTAGRTRQSRWYFLTGLLVASCGLTHLYGLFLLPALVILVLWSREQSKLFALAALLFGVILPWLGYGLYILQDSEAFRLQTRGYGERFDLFNLSWYLRNLVTEPVRFSVGLEQPSTLPRVGVWFSALALAASWFALALNVRQHTRPRVVFAPLTLLPLLFALLLQTKFTNYLVLIAPLAALATAWGIVSLWDALSKSSFGRTAHRAAIAFVLLLVVLEGSSRYVTFQSQASITTPYAQLVSQLKSPIPPGSRVLGLQDYWFGWEDYTYQSIAVPIMLINPLWNDTPPSFGEAMDERQPDHVLVDDAVREYFERGNPGAGAAFFAWLESRAAQRITAFRDPTYGWFEIYRVQRAP